MGGGASVAGHGRLTIRPVQDAPDSAAVRRIDLLALDDVPPGTMRMVEVDDGDLVLVVNVDGRLRAMQGICSHQYFELDKGFLTGSSLTCALHLSRFDLGTGEALDPPAEAPLAMYPVAVEDGETLAKGPYVAETFPVHVEDSYVIVET